MILVVDDDASFRHRMHNILTDAGLDVVLADGGLKALNAVHEQGDDQEEMDPSRVDAPMTGTLISVLVDVGQVVHEGQDLIVLSAMKMEHKLAALAAGTVSEVFCTEGETVDAGQLLLRLEVADD